MLERNIMETPAGGVNENLLTSSEMTGGLLKPCLTLDVVSSSWKRK
jgi:hypothetical protein